MLVDEILLNAVCSGTLQRLLKKIRTFRNVIHPEILWKKKEKKKRCRYFASLLQVHVGSKGNYSFTLSSLPFAFFLVFPHCDAPRVSSSSVSNKILAFS